MHIPGTACSPQQRKRNNLHRTPTGITKTHLVGVEDLQEGFVDVWLSLEPILDLVDIVDGVIKLNGLIVLQGWCGSQRDCHRCMRLDRRRAWRCIRWNRGSLLAGRGMRLQLGWLRGEGIIKRRRSHFRQEQIRDALNKGTFLLSMCRNQRKQPAHKPT